MAEDIRSESQKKIEFVNKIKETNIGSGCRLHSIANAASCQGYFLSLIFKHKNQIFTSKPSYIFASTTGSIWRGHWPLGRAWRQGLGWSLDYWLWAGLHHHMYHLSASVQLFHINKVELMYILYFCPTLNLFLFTPNEFFLTRLFAFNPYITIELIIFTSTLHKK